MIRAAADTWVRASLRERRMVVVAAIVVIGGLGWAWVWQPLVADTARLARDLPRERAVLAAARAQAADIVALDKAAASPRGPLVPSIERIVAERGLRAEAGPIDEKDGRVRLTFAAVRFDALVPLLAALTEGAGVRVTDATLAQRVEPGMVRAELALAR